MKLAIQLHMDACSTRCHGTAPVPFRSISLHPSLQIRVGDKKIIPLEYSTPPCV